MAAAPPQPALQWLKIREPLSARLKVGLGIIPLLLLLGIWGLLTAGAAQERIISGAILPSPWEVARSFSRLWFEAELSRSLVASTLRVVCGFAIGVLTAFPLGLLMGSFSKIRALFDPLAVFGAYLPIPALVPLTMSLFGIGELQKMMFLALAFFVYLLPLVVKAVDGVDDVYLRTAYTLGANRRQAVRHVLLGVAMPRIFDALRLGFGIGWTYIVLAEMVAAERGLGQIIIVAQRRGPREFIYWVLLVIVALAFVTDKLWVRLGRRLFPHEEAG
jgi:ABC-type nitrate/sulfonate/bicarbonate transport system permease component